MPSVPSSAPFLFLIAVVATLGATAAAAAPTPAPPDTGAVRGRVLDSQSGEPVAGVRGAVRGGDAETVTGADGEFVLRPAPAPPLTLVASRAGYEPALARVAGTEGGPLVLRLAPRLYRGEEVVVTASRYGQDLHLSQTNVTREQIAARADERDVPVLLSDLPGVHATSDAGNGVGYTYLNIRGFDQRRVGVMINGIPLNDPEDHQVYWVDMPDLAESLEDIQVQRGVTNSMGGMTAVGGTVNLVTEVLDAEPSGRLALQAGSYGTARQSLAWQSGLLGGRFATKLRVSHLESDGYRQRSGSDQWAVFWSGQYVAPRHQVQANAYTGRELTRHAWYGVGPLTLARDRTWNPETYHNAIDDFRQPHYEVHWRWNVSDRVLLRNSAFAVHGEGFYENFRGGERARDYSLDWWLGLDPTAPVDVVRRKWVRKDQVGWVPQVTVTHDRGRLVAGGDWYTFHSNHWGDVMTVAGFAPDGFPDGLKYADYEGDKTAWSAYVNERCDLGGGLTLLLDLQFQRKAYEFLQNEVGNFRAVDSHVAGSAPRNAFRVVHEWFNPKGGLFWRAPARPLGGELGLYAHVGTARREPADSDWFDAYQDAYDLDARPLFRSYRPVTSAGGALVEYLEWSDPVVQEEKVVNWETGLSWRARDVSLTVNGYWMDFRNEIVAAGAIDENGAPVRGNAGRTLHRGIEAGLTARLGARHEATAAFSRSWDEFDDYTYLETVYDPDTWEVVGVEARDYSGNPIAGFPRWLASATLVSRWGGLDTTLRLRGAGRQNLDNTGRAERTVAPWATLDAAAALDLGRATRGALAGARLDLRVRNVLDAEYATGGYWDEWDAADPGNHVFPAAGRNWLAGVRYEF